MAYSMAVMLEATMVESTEQTTVGQMGLPRVGKTVSTMAAL